MTDMVSPNGNREKALKKLRKLLLEDELSKILEESQMFRKSFALRRHRHAE